MRLACTRSDRAPDTIHALPLETASADVVFFRRFFAVPCRFVPRRAASCGFVLHRCASAVSCGRRFARVSCVCLYPQSPGPGIIDRLGCTGWPFIFYPLDLDAGSSFTGCEPVSGALPSCLPLAGTALASTAAIRYAVSKPFAVPVLLPVPALLLSFVLNKHSLPMHWPIAPLTHSSWRRRMPTP